jgi:hypothetical protein
MMGMVEIAISRLDAREFLVRVEQDGSDTSHRVSVPERLANGLELGEGDLERAVRESFAFLLEREPASSILRHFSLEEISRYFPEYPDELARRLARG